MHYEYNIYYLHLVARGMVKTVIILPQWVTLKEVFLQMRSPRDRRRGHYIIRRERWERGKLETKHRSHIV